MSKKKNKKLTDDTPIEELLESEPNVAVEVAKWFADKFIDRAIFNEQNCFEYFHITREEYANKSLIDRMIMSLDYEKRVLEHTPSEYEKTLYTNVLDTHIYSVLQQKQIISQLQDDIKRECIALTKAEIMAGLTDEFYEGKDKDEMICMNGYVIIKCGDSKTPEVDIYRAPTEYEAKYLISKLVADETQKYKYYDGIRCSTNPFLKTSTLEGNVFQVYYNGVPKMFLFANSDYVVHNWSAVCHMQYRKLIKARVLFV